MVRLAAVQDSPVSFNIAATIEKLDKLTGIAASTPHSADIVVFPEAFVSCYPRGLGFGAVVGSRSPDGREWFLRCHESAVDIEGDSPEWQAIKQIAREKQVILVLGVIEKDVSKHSTLFCTCVTIGRDGTLLAKHRKLMPTGSERLIWGQGDGSDLQIAQTDVGKIGAAICWENYMPLMRYAMYAMGVEIYCAPTADARDGWVSSMRHIATEGRCFVVSVNQFARKSDYPQDYPAYEDKPANHIVCRGGSVIVGPLGDILAGPLYDQSGILIADVDLRDIIRAKYDFDPLGHYSRPDVFHLVINNAAQSGPSFASS